MDRADVKDREEGMKKKKEKVDKLSEQSGRGGWRWETEEKG